MINALREAQEVARDLTIRLDALCAPAPNVAPLYAWREDGLVPVYPDLSTLIRRDLPKRPVMPKWRIVGDDVAAPPTERSNASVGKGASSHAGVFGGKRKKAHHGHGHGDKAHHGHGDKAHHAR